MNGGRRGPYAGDVILAIFLAVAGIVLLLTGGGCAILWLSLMGFGTPGDFVVSLLFLLLPLGIAAVGVLALRSAAITLRGASDPAPSNPWPGAEEEPDGLSGRESGQRGD